MEKILDRFLRYVAIDTQSDENSESQPSAAKELDLLKGLIWQASAKKDFHKNRSIRSMSMLRWWGMS